MSAEFNYQINYILNKGLSSDSLFIFSIKNVIMKVGDFMKKIFKVINSEQTIELGKRIGEKLDCGDVVLLIGDLSAGKTTITKGIGLGLGIKKVINSPTFTIVKVYSGRCPLYHLDLYRLDGINNDFDLEEYIEGDGVCVIEWPYQVSEILPDEYIKITLERTGDITRDIIVEAVGDRYDSVIEVL